jgi:hypothetical protein
MRWVFALLLIVAIAGCPAIPGIQLAIGKVAVTSATEDISVTAEAWPDELRGGRDLNVRFELTNLQPMIDLKDIYVIVYDQCIFTGTREKDIAEFAANATTGWTWKWSSAPVELERLCEVRFKTSYEGQLQLLQDVVVLSEAEYEARTAAETLGEIQITSSSSSNPLSIKISFSEPQPFLDGERYYMYIDYSYTGVGLIDRLDSEKITIKFPDNMKDISCDVYEKKNGYYNLTQALIFINRRAPRSTCAFTADSGDLPVKTSALSLIANYKYVLDDSFTVKVKPR